MVVICDFHSQGRGSIPRGGAFKEPYCKFNLQTFLVFCGCQDRRVATQLIEDGQRFAR